MNDEMAPLPSTDKPKQVVDIFEIRGNTEIPDFIEWMDDRLPGVEFDIPPVNSIVIARNGTYDVYLHNSALNAVRAEVRSSEYADREKQHMRLQILQTLGDVDRARAAEKWVLGE